MPKVGDKTLGEDRSILAMSLMLEFQLNFREIIINKIKIKAIRTDTAYPFLC